jgi:hypothetical protein
MTALKQDESWTEPVALEKRRTGLVGLAQLVGGYLLYFVAASSRPESQKQGRLKKVVSYPIRAIIGPLVVTTRGKWLVGFKLALVSGGETLTVRQRIDLAGQLHRLHASDELMRRPGRIYGLSSQFDPATCDKEWSRQLIMAPPSHILARHLAAREFQKTKLIEFGFRDLDLYIVFNLRDWRSAIMLAGIKLQILLLRRDSRILYANAANRFVDQIEALNEVLEQNGFPDARPMTQREMYWLIEKTVFPGHDIAKDNGIPDSEPLTDLAMIKLMTDNLGYDHGKALQLSRGHDGSPGSGGERYTSYLAVAKLPESIDYEWLFSGHKNGHPVEFVVNFCSTPPEKNKTLATKRNQRLVETYKLLRKTLQTSTDLSRLVEQRDTNEKVMAYSQANGVTLDLDIFILISASSLKQLQTLRTQYETRMRQRRIKFDTDGARQEEIRESLFIGNETSYNYHTQWLRTMGFAKSLYCADTGQGNGGAFHGFVVGRRLKPFLFSLSRVLLPEIDEAGLMVVCGPSGSGKTTWMAADAVAEASDGACCIFDEGAVKKDTIDIKQLNGIPVMHLDFTTFDGALNPGILGQTIDEKRDFITDFFQQCCKRWDSFRYSAPIQAAVDDLLKVPVDSEAFRRPDLLAAVEKLASGVYGPEGREVGAQIKLLAQHRHGKLFFSNKFAWEEIAKFMQPGVVTFVHYGEQEIPAKLDVDREKWSPSDHLAVLARRYGKHLFGAVASRRDIYVHLYFDEIHHDKKLGDDNYAEDYGRVARSKQTSVTLGSQAPEDFPESFYQYVAAVLMFAQKFARSAAACLPALNVMAEPGSDEYNLWLERLTNGLGKYHAYFRWLKFNPVMVKLQDHWTGDDFRTNNRARYEINQRHLAETTRALNLENMVRRQDTRDAARTELQRIGFWPDTAREQAERIAMVMQLQDGEAIERHNLGISLHRLLAGPTQDNRPVEPNQLAPEPVGTRS